MAKWIKRLAVIGERAKGRSLRRRLSMKSKPACDALEGRQLLSIFGGMRSRAMVGAAQAQVGRIQPNTRLFGIQQNDTGNSLGSTSGSLHGKARLHGRHTLTATQPQSTATIAQNLPSVPSMSANSPATAATPSSSFAPAGQLISRNQGTSPSASPRTYGGCQGTDSPATPDLAGAMQPGSFELGQGQNQAGGSADTWQGGPIGFFSSQGGNTGGPGQGVGGFALQRGASAGQINLAQAGGMQATSAWGQSAPTQGSGNSIGETSASLQQDFQKLGTDLQAIQDKSQVTPALLAAVRGDVQVIQKASTSAPTQASLTTLKNDLTALNGATPDFTQGALKADLEAALTSAGVSDATLQSKLEGDLNAVAAAMNVTPSDVAAIQADLNAVASDRGSSSTTDPTNNPLGDIAVSQLLVELAGQDAEPSFGPGGPSSIKIMESSGQMSQKPGLNQFDMLTAGGGGSQRRISLNLPFRGPQQG